MLIFQLMVIELLLEMKKFEMKWKKSQYNYGMSGGKKFLIFILIIIAIYLVLYYYDSFNIREETKKLFTKSKEQMNKVMETNNKEDYLPHTPEVDLEWCQPQNIPVDESETSPVSIQIIGADNIQNCCIKEFKGYNNCINQSSILQICYTSTIGGTIKTVKLNEKFMNPYYYQKFIKDIHKSYNQNYNPKIVCDLEIYGGIKNEKDKI